MIYNTALTLLSSRLSNGPGGSSRQRNSLTARLSKEKKKISWDTNKFTKESKTAESKSYSEASYSVLSKLVLLINENKQDGVCVFTQVTKYKYKIYRRYKDFRLFL